MSLINEKKDFSIISSLIPERSSVIDIGCNDGSLLEYLEINKKVDGRGMEIDQEKVQLCLSKGKLLRFLTIWCLNVSTFFSGFLAFYFFWGGY